MGKLLRINLTKKEVKAEEIKKEIIKKYPSGKWLSIKIFADEVKKTILPLSPKNKIVITKGLFSGSLWPASSTVYITTVSAFDKKLKTGSITSDFAFYFSNTEYDAIVIEGKSKNLTCIYIDKDTIKIEEENNLSQKSIYETKNFLQKKYKEKNISILSIGEAGEKILKSATVLGEFGENNTEGIGAVFGSKNLKCIVTGAEDKLNKIENRKFNKLCINILNEAKNASLRDKIYNFGTPYFIDKIKTNFVYIDEVSYPSLKRFKIKDIACVLCPVACRKYYRINTGRFNGIWSVNLGFEEILSLGVDLKIRVLPAVIFLNYLITKYGISDKVFSFFIKNIIELSSGKKNRMSLKYGEFDEIISVLKESIKRTSFGKIIGENKGFLEKKIGVKIKDKIPDYENMLYKLILESNTLKIKDIEIISLIFDLTGMCKTFGFMIFNNNTLKIIADAISSLRNYKISERILKTRAKEIREIENKYNRKLKKIN